MHHLKKEQLAIASVSTRGDLEASLRAYHLAGFENVEFQLRHVKSYLDGGRSIGDVKRLLEQNRLHCIGGFETGVRCFASPDECAANHDLIAANAALVAELGGRAMVVGTDGPAPGTKVDDPLGVIAQTVATLAERIEETGVTICIEFNWSPIVKSLRSAVEIARRSGHEQVGVLFDPAHYHCTPSKFEQINAESVPYIRHVHANDMRDKPGELSNCNADRVLPGQGCLNPERLFDALEKHGYQGYFSIEMFSEDLWRLPVEVAAQQMYDSMIALCQT